MSSILVGNIMSKSVISVAPEATVTEVVTLMRQQSYSCLVIAEHGRPVGIITERDILKLANLLLAGTSASHLKAGAIMTHPATTIRNSASLTEAMAICKDKKIRHLPVVNADGKLSGILTQSDLMNGFLQTIAKQSLDQRPPGQQAINQELLNPWDVNQPAQDDANADDLGDGIPDVNLNEVERELKGIFQAMHTEKNPTGAGRLQSRFI